MIRPNVIAFGMIMMILGIVGNRLCKIRQWVPRPFYRERGDGNHIERGMELYSQREHSNSYLAIHCHDNAIVTTMDQLKSLVFDPTVSTLQIHAFPAISQKCVPNSGNGEYSGNGRNNSFVLFLLSIVES